MRMLAKLSPEICLLVDCVLTIVIFGCMLWSFAMRRWILFKIEDHATGEIRHLSYGAFWECPVENPTDCKDEDIRIKSTGMSST